tara:strand:- start:1068 stop:2588 length:1521 start_codon:yes stop_codon:yes gene_type:complete
MEQYVINSDQFKAKVKNHGNQHMRTVTIVNVEDGKIVGKPEIRLYHTNVSGGRDKNGNTWSDPTISNLNDFESGGFVQAASSTDGGATWVFNRYASSDQDKGKLGVDGKVGDFILNDDERASIIKDASNGAPKDFYTNTQAALEQSFQDDAVTAGFGNWASEENRRTLFAKDADLAFSPEETTEFLETAFEEAQDIEFSSFESVAGERQDYGNWAYPLELRVDPELPNMTQQDRMIISAYSPEGSVIRTKLEIDSDQKRFERRLSERKGSVTLAIQAGIRDQNLVGWNDGTLNAVQAYAMGASLNIANQPDVQSALGAVANILKDAGTQLSGADNDYAKALKLYLAQEAVGVQGVLSRATGGILNPNLELLFSRPELRPFNFDIIMSPRDTVEGEEVRGIIRFFKQAMAVRKSKSSAFLKAPHIFKIRYLTFDNDGKEIGDHPSLNRIKECALVNCNVDYTPDNSYMTFDDPKRTMTQYRMQLQFKELDPIYETDYHDIEVNSIGF